MARRVAALYAMCLRRRVVAVAERHRDRDLGNGLAEGSGHMQWRSATPVAPEAGCLSVRVGLVVSLVLVV